MLDAFLQARQRSRVSQRDACNRIIADIEIGGGKRETTGEDTNISVRFFSKTAVLN